MEQNTVNYKRKTRQMPLNVRMKISAALKGVKKTPEHCRNISNGLKAETGGYWSKIPQSPVMGNDNHSL